MTYRGMMGDYLPGYRGRRGDPGIFGAIGHVLGGAVTGFIKGGPFGAITGAIGGAVKGTQANIQEATLAAGGSGSAYTPALRARHAAIVAAHKTGVTAPVGGSIAGTAHGRLRLALAGGGGGGGGRRRMNWANSKALGRAERRIKSAVKHFGRYFRWVHPTKHPGAHLAPAFKKRSKSR